MPASPRLRPAHAFVALLVGAACAGRPPQTEAAPDHAARNAALLSAWRPAAGQKCTIASIPAALPTVDELVDTTDLAVYLGQGGVLQRRGYALISLKFDSAGAPARVMVIESDLPGGIAQAAELAARTALRPQAGSPRAPRAEWGVRLRIDVDSTASYRVGRSERCEPYLPRTARWDDRPPPGLDDGRTVATGRQKMTMRLLVGVDGRVLHAEFLTLPGASLPGRWSHVESLTDQQNFAHQVLRHVREQQWQPGLDDRVPVAMPVIVTNQMTTVVKIRR